MLRYMNSMKQNRGSLTLAHRVTVPLKWQMVISTAICVPG